MRFIFVSFLLFLLIGGSALAQISMNDLYSPNRKTSCADTVSVPDLMEKADLAFTGRVLKRSDNYTWFRAYKFHKGKSYQKIIKAAGFYAHDKQVAGAGQSYDAGETYTVILRRPDEKQDGPIKADYINSLNQCEESIVSKIHDRYGNYRVQSSELEPGLGAKIGNHFFFMGSIYGALFFIGICGALFYRYKEQLSPLLAKIMGVRSGSSPER